MSTAPAAATAEGVTEMAVVMAPVAATAEGVTEMAVVMAPAASTAEGVTEMAMVMAPAAATAEEVTEMVVVIGMTTEMAPAAAAATVAGETETTGIAKFAINFSKADFLAIPCTDPECDSVDSEYGLWVKCAVCESIMNHKANPPPPFQYYCMQSGQAIHSGLMDGSQGALKFTSRDWVVSSNQG
jgi:hypothetical protein